MGNKNNKTLKEETTEDQTPINLSELVEKVEEEIEDINFSYSETSSYGGGLSSPPPRMIKV